MIGRIANSWVWESHFAILIGCKSSVLNAFFGAIISINKSRYVWTEKRLHFRNCLKPSESVTVQITATEQYFFFGAVCFVLFCFDKSCLVKVSFFCAQRRLNKACMENITCGFFSTGSTTNNGGWWKMKKLIVHRSRWARQRRGTSLLRAQELCQTTKLPYQEWWVIHSLNFQMLSTQLNNSSFRMSHAFFVFWLLISSLNFSRPFQLPLLPIICLRIPADKFRWRKRKSRRGDRMNEEIPSWDWERLSPCALTSLVRASCQCFLVPHSSRDDISRKGDFEKETLLQVKCLDIHFLRAKEAKKRYILFLPADATILFLHYNLNLSLFHTKMVKNCTLVSFCF